MPSFNTRKMQRSPMIVTVYKYKSPQRMAFSTAAGPYRLCLSQIIALARWFRLSYFSQPLGPAHCPLTMYLLYTHGKKSFFRW